MRNIKTYENYIIEEGDVRYPVDEIWMLIEDYLGENYKEWEKDGWIVQQPNYMDKYSIKVGNENLFSDRYLIVNGSLEEPKKSRLNIKVGGSQGIIIGMDGISLLGMTKEDMKAYDFQKRLLEKNEDHYKFILNIGVNDKIKDEYDYLFRSKELGLL